MRKAEKTNLDIKKVKTEDNGKGNKNGKRNSRKLKDDYKIIILDDGNANQKDGLMHDKFLVKIEVKNNESLKKILNQIKNFYQIIKKFDLILFLLHQIKVAIILILNLNLRFKKLQEQFIILIILLVLYQVLLIKKIQKKI